MPREDNTCREGGLCMDFDKAGFAEALGEAIDRRGWTLEEAGEILGVKHTTVSNWRNPAIVDKPLKKRWPVIKEKTGVDPFQYVLKATVDVSGSRSQGIIMATNGATVNAACGGSEGGKYTVDLTEFEYNIWQLFRKFGNSAVAERCFNQLKALEATSKI